MNGQKLDSTVLSRADYEALVRDGLQNIELLAKLAQGHASIQTLEGWLSTISAQSAALTSLLNKLK